MLVLGVPRQPPGPRMPLSILPAPRRLPYLSVIGAVPLEHPPPFPWAAQGQVAPLLARRAGGRYCCCNGEEAAEEEEAD